MKILLLGGTGQVGFELQRSLSSLGEITSPNRDILDLLNYEAVESFLNKNEINLIVNAAAWTNVDDAENSRTEAKRLNAELPKQLSFFCKKKKIRLVHYSTDYVFNGSGTKPWTEISCPNPINFYGKTKLLGEEYIRNSSIDFLIFRISWIYSIRRSNFMKTILKLAKKQSELKIVSDQYGSPTPAKIVADITFLALQRNLDAGVYHLAPRGETTWYDFSKT